MSTNEHPDGKKQRRRGPWPPGGLQFKIFLSNFVITGIILGIGVTTSLPGLFTLQSQSNTVPPPIIEALNAESLQPFTIAAVAVVFLSISAEFANFDVADAIYRFQTFLRSFTTGRWDRKCTLRSRDSLTELNAAINGRRLRRSPRKPGGTR